MTDKRRKKPPVKGQFFVWREYKGAAAGRQLFLLSGARDRRRADPGGGGVAVRPEPGRPGKRKGPARASPTYTLYNGTRGDVNANCRKMQRFAQVLR